MSAMQSSTVPVSEPLNYVASLYALWMLDEVNVYATAVAIDCVARPRLYRSDSLAGNAERLADLLYKQGFDPGVPDRDARDAIFSPVFGAWGAKTGVDGAQFVHASDALMSAATEYAMKLDDVGKTILRGPVLQAAITLQVYLKANDGFSLKNSFSRVQGLFEKSQAILSAPSVAGVFGLEPAGSNSWPLDGVYDGDGAYLLEKISHELGTTPNTTQTRFISLQRVADLGSQVLGRVLAFDANPRTRDKKQGEALDEIVNLAYLWRRACDEFDSSPECSIPQNTRLIVAATANKSAIVPRGIVSRNGQSSWPRP